VATDFTHGLGEAISSTWRNRACGSTETSGSPRASSSSPPTCPYNFGATRSLLNEIMPVRRLPDQQRAQHLLPRTVTARELVVDDLAKLRARNAGRVRKAFLKATRACARAGEGRRGGKWAARCPPDGPGHAIHNEYKSRVACLMEIDTRPATVKPSDPRRLHGPADHQGRVRRRRRPAHHPRGIEAQMMGGAMERHRAGTAAGLHLENGLPLEGSWDDYRYTRQ